MKTLMTIAAFIVMVFTLALPAFATTVSLPAVPISASVDSSLTLTATIFKDSGAGPVGSALASINFGQLQVFTNTLTNGQTLRSSDTGTGAVMGGAVALISANSHGAHYVISETGTVLTSGSNTIPANACGMVPVYAAADNGGNALPAGAAVGAKASWVTAVGNTIYNSEASNTAMRTVQAHFSITDDPAGGAQSGGAVLLNQAGGSYSGTITFTVVSP